MVFIYLKKYLFFQVTGSACLKIGEWFLYLRFRGKNMSDLFEHHLRAGDLNAARDILLANEPTENARRLGELPPEQRAAVFVGLPRPDAVGIFLHMDDEEQASLLESLSQADAAALTAHLPSHTIARSVSLLADELRGSLLAGLNDKKRTSVERILAYDTDSVQRVMREDYLAANAETTVQQAMDLVRANESASEEMASVLFVIDSDDAFLGHVSLASLLRAAPTARLGALVNEQGITLQLGDNKVDAARLLQRSDLSVLPVLDSERRLQGALCFSDAMDVLDEDTSEDVYKKAGIGDLIHNRDVVRSEKLTSGGIGYSVKVRLAFLMVTLVGGLVVGGVIDFFEETLAAVVALAIFIPLVMDMGGNVGTQSTTIFARGLALGHIRMDRFFRGHLIREGMVGLAMGVVIAVLAGLIAYFWQGAPNDIPLLGVVVGVALFVAVFTASILGFLLPWILVKIGVDHAPGADPFITTIKDFTGLAVYFAMAAWLLAVQI